MIIFNSHVLSENSGCCRQRIKSLLKRLYPKTSSADDVCHMLILPTAYLLIGAYLLSGFSGRADAFSFKILKKGNEVHFLTDGVNWFKDVYNGLQSQGQWISPVLQNASGSSIKTRGGEPIDRQAQRLKEKSKAIDREIEKHKADVKAFTREEAKIVDSLNDIDVSMNNLKKRIAGFKKELDTIGKKITVNTLRSQELQKTIRSNETYMSRRLVALYKLNWFGRIHVLASAESMYDLFQRKTGIERILQSDETIRKTLLSDKTSLEALLQDLKAQKKEKAAVEKKYAGQLKLLSKDKERRSVLLKEIRSKKTLELAAIDSLQKAARALDDKFKALSVAAPQSPPSKKTSEKPFAELKGLLNMPVKGKVVSQFGYFKNTKFNVENFNSGIDIKADRGEPIHAVGAGKVLFSSWFKGYGNMIIIDHGNSYYTVYAHAEEIFKSKGDAVETQEVIATVGDTGSMKGPGLYFEVRHHGKPLDPMIWVNKG